VRWLDLREGTRTLEVSYPSRVTEVGSAPGGVGMTAVGVAYIRAQESLRKDRLFEDPLAARFVEASGWTPPDSVEAEVGDASADVRAYWGTVVQSVIVRTRFLDEYAMDAAASGVRQFVILGAGLDARAFRLAWPSGMRVFEIDVPDMIDFKENALTGVAPKPRAQRIVVPADLTADWFPRLQDAGFDPSQQSGWLAEGLLIYLTAEHNEALLRTISTASLAGSRLGITLGGKGSLDVPGDDGLHGEALGSVGSVRAMWQSEAPDDPAAWLAGHGWDAEVFSARERAAAYGRPLPDDAPQSAMRALVRAVRF
jgi:methyltransferase (TIGR00027 family)